MSPCGRSESSPSRSTARVWFAVGDALGDIASVLRKAADGMRLCEHLDVADGAAVFHHACRMGLEGIVAKRRDRPYDRADAPTRSRSNSALRVCSSTCSVKGSHRPPLATKGFFRKCQTQTSPWAEPRPCPPNRTHGPYWLGPAFASTSVCAKFHRTDPSPAGIRPAPRCRPAHSGPTEIRLSKDRGGSRLASVK
jgi:hypothetical protein